MPWLQDPAAAFLTVPGKSLTIRFNAPLRFIAGSSIKPCKISATASPLPVPAQVIRSIAALHGLTVPQAAVFVTGAKIPYASGIFARLEFCRDIS